MDDRPLSLPDGQRRREADALLARISHVRCAKGPDPAAALEVTVRIRAASPADEGAIESLLRAAGLDPPGGHGGFLLADEGAAVIGCVAIVQVGDFAVVRSMAVASQRRGLGVGGALLRAAVASARRRRVTACYLRTLSAETFYRRNGWSPCPDVAVPGSVRATLAWRLAHPRSRGMCLVLDRDPFPGRQR